MSGFLSTVLAKTAVMLIEALLMRVIQSLVISLARTGRLQAA
ncbi:hypothetical protein OG884_23490 [Streptosporangium sp. NBC_01755]|nr:MULTISPECIES: hypothetical protein [unclassified Streptosporangium]WSA24079.1 hypothetical protein OIE13_24435 [Streptosporangium sp. NBC_01810]WSC97849.1 hypothetical protein OG884_23490 [Streptosporangium sp. NBC_01755]